MSRSTNDVTRDDHWLTRASTVRALCWWLAAMLALSVLAQFIIPVKGNVPLEGSFGFGAWYGFVCCVAIVLVARVLGWWLKRPEEYYADAGIEPSPQAKDVVKAVASETLTDVIENSAGDSDDA